MKKILLLLSTVLLSLTLLAACGNEDEGTTSNENQNTEENVTAEEVQEDTTEETTEEETEVSDEEESDGKTGSNTMNSSFKVTEEPQTDLKLGDTALVQTTIGTYELTIHSGEIVGTELDGEKALLDEIILLEMTFTNVGDLPIVAEDVMVNLGLTTDLEASDNTNAAASFDSIEFFEGEIAPGESREAQFIADTRTADEYYFRTSVGSVAAGTQNEVIFTILDEEVRGE